ncbi:unnamed protein product [Schistocephalus solidus]|uniref:RRM domain-containing protein n=1 Tax=Schistocephalus solidus TaxID=70667 RepID=A0A183SVA4_SCHSO|nr:unnamed protein product [Schistocephalus solidus]
MSASPRPSPVVAHSVALPTGYPTDMSEFPSRYKGNVYIVNLRSRFFTFSFQLSLQTLDNLDIFLQVCNLVDVLRDLLMIVAGSDGFASLIGGLCSQQGRISMMIS